ncbi:hypothetical protein AbraIFM66950_005668 [Aspergillus brasiliensis]|nr:hypothetical protein AbraIFM66950_005668 [Aspergillus brasiliensis]
MCPDMEKAKERISNYSNQGRLLEEKLKVALDASLEWLPEGGKEALVGDILDATSDDKLHGIFFNIFTILAWPALLESETSDVRIPEEDISPLETRDQDMQDDCLERDNYCCVITGAMDTATYFERFRPAGFANVQLQIAHIMPYSISHWNESAMTTLWDTLCRYFPAVHEARIKAGSINALVNSLSNSLSMQCRASQALSLFGFTLKATDRPNVYKTVLFPTCPHLVQEFLPDEIEFKPVPGTGTEEDEELDLPSKELLDCHYHLAHILNACGYDMAHRLNEYWCLWQRVDRRNVINMLDEKIDMSNYLNSEIWELPGS